MREHPDDLIDDITQLSMTRKLQKSERHAPPNWRAYVQTSHEVVAAV